MPSDLHSRENPYNVTQASRIYFLPNLMTAGNLLCGFGAVIRCIQARLIATLDNLGKGASGAAVQSLNLMAGLPETAGLCL